MTNAQVEGSLPAARLTIASGRLAVGDRRFDGILPLPFEATGDVRLEINGLAANLTATAEAVSVRPIGEARFVEEFRP